MNSSCVFLIFSPIKCNVLRESIIKLFTFFLEALNSAFPFFLPSFFFFGGGYISHSLFFVALFRG